MDLYIVEVSLDSTDSACADDVSESRVFNDVGKALGYYKDTKKRHYIKDGNMWCDYVRLYTAWFNNGVLEPISCIKRTDLAPATARTWHAVPGIEVRVLRGGALTMRPASDVIANDTILIGDNSYFVLDISVDESGAVDGHISQITG